MTKDDDFDERRLVERVIAGQPGADKEFIDRYDPVVVRVLRRFERISQEDRDDCWQTAFLKLFDNDYARLKAWLRAWRVGCSLSSYIAVMAKNVAYDLLRSRTFVKDGKTFKREVSLEPGFDRAGENESSGDTMGLPSEEIIRQVASTCLTPRQLEIYVRYCRGENAQEIGQALNMTTNNVFVEKHRMIRALRECLRQRGLWPL